MCQPLNQSSHHILCTISQNRQYAILQEQQHRQQQPTLILPQQPYHKHPITNQANHNVSQRKLRYEYRHVARKGKVKEYPYKNIFPVFRGKVLIGRFGYMFAKRNKSVTLSAILPNRSERGRSNNQVKVRTNRQRRQKRSAVRGTSPISFLSLALS